MNSLWHQPIQMFRVSTEAVMKQQSTEIQKQRQHGAWRAAPGAPFSMCPPLYKLLTTQCAGTHFSVIIIYVRDTEACTKKHLFSMTKLKTKDLLCFVQKYANQVKSQWKELFVGVGWGAIKLLFCMHVYSFNQFSDIQEKHSDKNSLYVQTGCLSLLRMKTLIVTVSVCVEASSLPATNRRNALVVTLAVFSHRLH